MLLWYLITCLVWLIALCWCIIHMTCSWPGCHVCSACVRGLKMTNRLVWSDWEYVSFTWTDRWKIILYFLINNFNLCCNEWYPPIWAKPPQFKTYERPTMDSQGTKTRGLINPRLKFLEVILCRHQVLLIVFPMTVSQSGGSKVLWVFF